MERLGAVLRLQVQTGPVKERGAAYRPERIAPVDAAALGPDGMLGLLDGAWVVDVHHRLHPECRSGRRRALSFGFTSHYAAMTERYGATVADGVAGENVIVAVDRRISEDDLAGGLLIRTATGEELAVDGLRVAAPCAEFTSYLLGLPQVAATDEIADDLAFLHDGTRGFVAGLAEDARAVVVRVGDEVWRR